MMAALLIKLYIVTILALVLIYLVIKYEDKKEKRTIEKIFEGRVPLTKDEFYIRYYQQQGIPKDIVSGVIKTLEEYLGTDLSRLHPTDSFSTNLSYFLDIDEWADVEIKISLETVFSFQFSDEDHVCTIDDIIQLIWKKTKASQDISNKPI